jgi:hypothetical protein
MNPNRLTRELRKLPGNIRSPHLPGGTLISAVLDRRLMAWSDRGGASRIFGDVWSDHCWRYIRNGGDLFPDLTPYIDGSIEVVRLDDNPRIAIQAGRNKLPNPDFLIVETGPEAVARVRAVDAKFAVDRLRRTQVSPESIRELLELPDSLAKVELQQRLGTATPPPQIEYLPGMFLGPSSLLNDYFYQQITSGEDPDVPRSELKLVPVPEATLFAGIEEHPLMEEMRSIDGLTPSSNGGSLVMEMYYLRLSTAARWFADQASQPILTLDDPVSVPVPEVLSMTQNRIESGVSAFGLIESWSQEVERAIERRKQVQDSARLPLRMSEIRKLIENSDSEADKKTVRIVRGMLEKHFMRRLVEETGTIPADSPEPFGRIIDRVHTTSKGLRNEMQATAREVVQSVIESAAE